MIWISFVLKNTGDARFVWQSLLRVTIQAVARCLNPNLILMLAAGPLGWNAFAQEHAPSPIAIEKMRTMAYSKEMAQRFGLPEPRQGWETQSPLHGIEFVVETAPPWAKGHICAYKLYLDSSLPLAFGDDGPAGDFTLYVPAQHFFARDWDNPLGRPANIALGQKVSEFSQLGFVATSDYLPRKRGASIGIGLQDQFHRELFSGLTYLKIGRGCVLLSWERRADTVVLWLKKAGGKDYRKVLDPDPSEFVKLPLPEGFYRETLPWREEIGKETSRIVKEMDKDLRERQLQRRSNAQ